MTAESPWTARDQYPSPERGEWLRFWKIVLFATILPFLIPIVALEALGWSLGEVYIPGALSRALDRHPDLVWSPLRVETHAMLKLVQVARDRPEVVIMGNSKLGRVRADMFRPYTFYNLTRVSWLFYTYPDILRHFPKGYRPKLIVVDADFFMFSRGYTEYWIRQKVAPVYGYSFSDYVGDLESVWTQVLYHHELLWKRTDSTGRPAFGLAALGGGFGFLKDGSELAPPATMAKAGRSPEDIMRPGWKDYLGGGDKMGEAEMAAFKEFVDLARQMGIPMVAVQMPMYGPALRQLEADPKFGILQDYRNHVAQGYFDRLGIPFFDYINFPPYSEDYRYFIDAAHPGEPFTQAVIAALASDSRFHALLPRLDPQELQQEVIREKTANQHIILNQ